jgi:hypothetical protein
MKIYPFILIDKNNMTKIEHYTKVEDLVHILATKKKLHHCVVVKDELKVLKFPIFHIYEIYTHKTFMIRAVLEKS